MIISQSGVVDLIPEYNRALRPIFCVSEGDAGSRMINLTVQNAGENFTIPAGAMVYVAGRKKDNTIFSYQCMFSGYIVTFPVSAQMSAEDGVVLCELQIVVNSEPLGSANFVYWVEPSPIENGIASESDLNIFEQAIALLSNFDHFYADVEDLVTEAVSNIQIHEGQTVIDASLSVSGAAADAKATGDMARNFLEALMTETTTEASIASIDDGAGGLPLKQFVGNIQPTQAGSGDPSPENVRPISGYTGVTVMRASKNLLAITGNTTTSGGITFTYNGDGTVTATGTSTGNTNNNYGYVTLPAGTYLVSGCTGGATNTYRIRLGKDAWGGSVIAQNYDGDTEFTLEEETAVYVRIYVGVAAGENVNITFKPMIRLASVTDSTYEPYVGATYPVTFPTEAGTVYGGTLTVNSDGSGTLTVDSLLFSKNSSTMDNSDAYPGWRQSGLKAMGFSSGSFNTLVGNVGKNINLNMSGSNDVLYLPTGSYGLTQTEWIERAIDIEFVIPTPTPTTYALSAVQVAQLMQGVNNVWMDANGTVQMTYYANTAIYIDKRIAAIIGTDGNAW